ncbi:MAG: hypothetical protein IT459_05645 [Planctomycetes bacterium]|nr:hypothetical protein [Planctomycetota bacterium]
MQTTQVQPRLVSISALPKKSKWLIIAAGIYLALPGDVIPILGFIGDLSAFVIALSAMKNGLLRQQENAHVA